MRPIIFKLTRHFAIASAIGMVIVTLLLVIQFRHASLQEVVKSAEMQNAALARAFANSIWARYAPYVNSVGGQTGPALRARPETGEIHADLKALTHDLSVLKVKIYDLNGLTVFSSQPSQIGESRIRNLGYLKAAKDGGIASKISFRDRFSAFSGELFNRHVVESYLPINQIGGRPEGVFELYTDVTPMIARINNSTREFVLILAGIFTVLYGFLFLIVRHASRIMKRQYSEIENKNEALEREIGERIGAENALMQAKEAAEHADSAKSRFLASASHDLRQPLQAATLYMEMARLEDVEGTSRTSIGKGISSLGAATGILNAMLDISKLDAGLIECKNENVRMSEIFRRIQDFSPLTATLGIGFKIVQSGAVVNTDPVLLETILRNLLSNAVKYTESGRILIGCRRLRSTVRIEVWDTGKGISKDQLDAIFEEFYQVDNTARDRKKGLGLGLSIVRRTAALLGHAITVRSEIGRGSVFTVEVPLSGGDVLPEENKIFAEGLPDPVIPSCLDRGTVIIVDDEPEILKSLSALMTTLGFTPLSCRFTGQTCPEYLNLFTQDTQPPTLIICDFRLPDGMSGIDVVSQLRDHIGDEIPALILTGDISEETLRQITESDLQLLHKPVNFETLRTVIDGVLNESAGSTGPLQMDDAPAGIFVPDSLSQRSCIGPKVIPDRG